MSEVLQTSFPAEVLSLIEAIDPLEYKTTRNYLDGNVTRLSPYFTHGIVTAHEVASHLVASHGREDCMKLLSEFAWREFFQCVYVSEGERIFVDMKSPQSPVDSERVPAAFLNGNTGIDVIDDAIIQLYQTGEMHNHERMWVAGLICNVAKTHWPDPAKWLYYHLLDGDLASNHLSWQWIAGTFSHKKYVANQENLNKYSKSKQRGTCIDLPYEELIESGGSAKWHERAELDLRQELPESDHWLDDDQFPIALHSIWNLSASWLQDEKRHHILLIEPSFCERFPMSAKRWEFILKWAREIKGLQVVAEDFSQFSKGREDRISFQEHPSLKHWKGMKTPFPRLFPEINGYYPSFSKFWKRAQFHLHKFDS